MATSGAKLNSTESHLRTGKRSIPIVGIASPDLDASNRRKIRDLADRIRKDQPTLSDISAFGQHVRAGLMDAPAIFIGDASEIALFSSLHNQFYGYRLSLLAEEGDLILFDAERDSKFEYYRSTVLGLNAVEFLQVPQDIVRPNPLARRASDNTLVFARLVEWARQHPQINLIPHIGSQSVWHLAARINQATGAQVYVTAPPPRLTAHVNNKLWFSNLVKQLLGAGSVPRMHGVYGPHALAGTLAEFAERYERIVVKIPDSAGSQGNFAFDAGDICGRPLIDIENQCLQLLHGRGWEDTYPVLVEVWDTNVIASPSVQIWIPDADQCDPVVEGVFEQVVQGTRGEFVGSRHIDLPDRVQDCIMKEATIIASLFQQLGYFGRCSFDAVMAGSDLSDFNLHWIECNGRWGGVSIPMTLVNRLTGNGAHHPFTVQRVHRPDSGFETDATERAIGPDLLYDRRTGEGAILITPPTSHPGTRINIISVGSSPDRTLAISDQVTSALTNA